jgi:CO/xanthine dehydrogenase Mo-binding subunit
MKRDFVNIGKRLPRVDAIVKATGEAKYAGDLSLPGMLHGKLLRSPYPHARVLHSHDKAEGFLEFASWQPVGYRRL